LVPRLVTAVLASHCSDAVQTPKGLFTEAKRMIGGGFLLQNATCERPSRWRKNSLL